MSQLALLGGKAIVTEPLRVYQSIGTQEAQAVAKVMQSGNLSAFIGKLGEAFYGGPAVKEFESAWAQKFKVKHAVSVNSATSGLFAAMGAIGLNPGEEVIVPPYSMSATAMAPLIYGGIPVFADIEADTFCLDPDDVLRKITSKTKAILAVNLFGHPAQLHRLKEIAKQKGIFLIEDNAQGPLATENGKFAGTIGDIGVFSLNYHKHIHTGEGGVCTTDNDELAVKLQLIRNHGENAVAPLELNDISNMIGFNYRLTELGAAIGIEQLKKADHLVGGREKLAKYLIDNLSQLPGIKPAMVRPDCRHVFYVLPFKYDASILGISRQTFCKALAAEGFPMISGYVDPLYWLPTFQKKIAFGNSGYPFNLGKVNYDKGLCPVVERMHYSELMYYGICSYDLTNLQMKQFVDAFHKVYEKRTELKAVEQPGVVHA